LINGLHEAGAVPRGWGVAAHERAERAAQVVRDWSDIRIRIEAAHFRVDYGTIPEWREANREYERAVGEADVACRIDNWNDQRRMEHQRQAQIREGEKVKARWAAEERSGGAAAGSRAIAARSYRSGARTMSKIDPAHYLKHTIDGSEFVEKLVAALDARTESILAEFRSQTAEESSPEAERERGNKRTDAAFAAITAARAAKVIPMPETVLDCLHVALLVAELARKQLRLERRRQMRPEERAALHETLRTLEELAMLQPIDPGARARLTKSVAVWQTLLADGDPERAAHQPRGLN
jgi:hypothetical protein